MAASDLGLSFKYKDNAGMTGDIKDALANFDMNKTGHVSTSELIAGAKALQEARNAGGIGGALKLQSRAFGLTDPCWRGSASARRSIT